MKDRYSVLVDIGTTTIAIAIFDKKANSVLDVGVYDNPQREYGLDVISRIKSQIAGNGRELSECVKFKLIKSALSLCNKNKISPADVGRVIIGANTTMIHLLMGYDCSPLAAAPFKVEAKSPKVFEASPADILRESEKEDLSGYEGAVSRESLASCEASVCVEIIPWASAFIGGDIISGLYAIEEIEGADGEGADAAEAAPDDVAAGDVKSKSAGGRYLFIDLGTNGEMVLSDNGRLFATATAAGPAFEGAGLSCGVAGIRGAISSVRLNKLRAVLTTIDNALPIGICGSGAVSLASELKKISLINPDSSISPDFPEGGFILAEHSATPDKHPVIFTADDIHNVLLAKAAIAAGIDTLLKASGLSASDVERVYLAGGFGYNMDISAADDIRLFSEINADKIIPVGNSVLLGLEIIARKYSYTGENEIKLPKLRTINLGTSDYFKGKYIEHLRLGR